MGIFHDISRSKHVKQPWGSHRELAEQQTGREGGRRAASMATFNRKGKPMEFSDCFCKSEMGENKNWRMYLTDELAKSGKWMEMII